MIVGLICAILIPIHFISMVKRRGLSYAITIEVLTLSLASFLCYKIFV